MKRILYVVNLDKFTEGFYKFIRMNFPDQDNQFIFYGKLHDFDFLSSADTCYWIETYRKLNSKHRAVVFARNCDAIIYSGIFGCERLALKFGLQTLKKSYFQLWGGDYNCFRNINQMSLKDKMWIIYRKYVLYNAKVIINLIPSEYDSLVKLCKIKGQHMVAPVPDDGTRKRMLNDLCHTPKSMQPIMIQIGNSATLTNQHVHVLKILERFKNENIQIICPLSYGNMEYAEQITKKGTELFGTKFVALREYIPLSEYYKLLSNVKVAVFNNDRQQAMGNINAALALGCKVFIRSDTPMWKTYNERGYFISDVDELAHVDFNELIEFPDDKIENNIECYNRNAEHEIAKKAWAEVFASI